MMNMEEHFTLNEKVYLVHGPVNSAIYDPSQSKQVFAVGNLERNLLSAMIEDRLSFVEMERLGKERGFLEDSEQLKDFLKSLEERNLGRVCNLEDIIPQAPPPKPEQKLEFVWLELTQGCNEACSHCSSGSEPEIFNRERDDMRSDDDRVISYKGDIPRLVPRNIMTHKEWLDVIDEVAEMGIQRIQFIGGEPFLYDRLVGREDALFELIERARAYKIPSIEVFTNGTFIDERRADKLKELGVHVAVSVYGPNEEIHEGITNTKGSFKKTIRAIQLLVERGIQPRTAIVGMKQNEDCIEDTMTLSRGLGVRQSGYDLVRPAGRGCSSQNASEKLFLGSLMTHDAFGEIDEETFNRWYHGHSCLNGKVYITSNGEVNPCVMSRNHSIGNVKFRTLTDIINGNSSRSFWQMSKDYIEVCGDCEKRYVCFDCRPKASNPTGNLLEKPAECLYNPYTGKWATREEYSAIKDNQDERDELLGITEFRRRHSEEVYSMGSLPIKEAAAEDEPVTV